MPTDERHKRTRLNLPLAGRRLLEFEPLAHALFALALSGACLVLAIWTLWPESGSDRGPAVVHAAQAASPGNDPRKDANRPSLADAPRTARTDDPRTSHLTGTPGEETSPPDSLQGTIVDEFRRPVAFAVLWIDRSPWEPWGTSDAAGRFSLQLSQVQSEELQSAGPPLRIAARSRGYAPSRVLSLSRLPREAVQLVLPQRGSSLQLEITDEIGTPLAGVHIALTPLPPSSVTGSMGMQQADRMPTPRLTSDIWGLAHMDGLAPGPHDLLMQLPGYSLRRGRITLNQGGLSVHPIVMKRNASLHGRIVRADGGPLGQSLVRVTSEESMEAFETLTDTGGRYHLEGLPAGPVLLHAQGPEHALLPMEANTRRHLTGGRSELWSPTLLPVQRIHGQLLDAGGGPLAGWRVELSDEGRLGRMVAGETDSTGSYDLPSNGPIGKSVLSFFHPAAGRGIPTRSLALRTDEGRAEDLRLDEEEDTVSRMIGQILDPGGHPLSNGYLLLSRTSGHAFLQITLDEQGRFATPPIPPGLYIPVFPQHGMGWTPDLPLRVHGLMPSDIGILQLPPLGRLSVMTSTPDRYSEQREIELDLLRPGISAEFRQPIYRGTLEAPVEIVLAPGDYELRFPDKQGAPIMIHIDSGECTVFALPGLE